MFLNFGFLTKEALWVRQILKFWCRDKKNENKYKFKFYKNLKTLTDFYQMGFQTSFIKLSNLTYNSVIFS